MVAQNDQAIQSIMQEYVVNRNPRTTPSWVGFVGESEQRLVIQNKLQTLSRDNMMEQLAGLREACIAIIEGAIKSANTFTQMVQPDRELLQPWNNPAIPHKMAVGSMACIHKNWIYDAKRMLGKEFQSKDLKELKRTVPFTILAGINERACIKPFGTDEMQKNRIQPEVISARVLMKMKELADQRTGKNVTKAVVTVPAFFNALQKQATMDACRIAGLNTLRLIAEPTSAAIAYKFADQENEEEVKEEDDDKIVLIFDIGGGTFDVTLLQSTDGLIDVLGTSGDMLLGGRDFD